MMRYPQDLSDKLFEFLEKSRQTEFDRLQGEPKDIEELKAHKSRIEPVPTRKEAKDLLDAAFFASLAQEEGQSVSFSLTYTDPNVATESKWPRLQFTKPAPLSTEHIRKLSPAAPPCTVDIAVFPQEGSLKIWGLLYLRSKSPGQRSYPLGLSIRSVQPGAFLASFSDREILAYSRGEAVFFGADQTFDATQLRLLLSQVFSDSQPFPEKYKLAARLLEMASVPLEAGFGATLLLIPEICAPAKGLDEPRYDASGTCRAELLSMLTSPDHPHVAAALSRLMFIDGAVVFCERDGLMGAGAMIRTGDSLDFSVLILAPHDPAASPIKTSFLGFNGGARHRSSLAFCHANPGALAIVISQDGVLSLMVRPLESDSVHVIRPIRRGTQLS